MSSVTSAAVLDQDDLSAVDEILLDYLNERCVTPAYCRIRMAEEYGEDRDYTRGYVQQQLARLVEHGHAENLYDTGLYELRDDPRDENSN